MRNKKLTNINSYTQYFHTAFYHRNRNKLIKINSLAKNVTKRDITEMINLLKEKLSKFKKEQK